MKNRFVGEVILVVAEAAASVKIRLDACPATKAISKAAIVASWRRHRKAAPARSYTITQDLLSLNGFSD